MKMKKNITAGASLLTSLVFAAGCGDENQSKAPETGAATFARICATCHGPAGLGMTGLGKDITTSAFVASQSDEQLLAFIIGGRDADHPDNTTGVPMPPRGGDPNLEDEQIHKVIKHVRSIQVEPENGP